MDEVTMVETMERLAAAATALEQAVERMTQRQESFAAEAEETVGRIVATVETAREAELEKKLMDAEKKIAEMSAAASAAAASGRKTVAGGVGRMFAKEESMEVAGIDGALTSLSVEQRIAVKAALMRAGMVG